METLKADVLELLSGAGFYTTQYTGAYTWYSGNTSDYGFSANWTTEGSIPGHTSSGGGVWFVYDKNGKIVSAV